MTEIVGWYPAAVAPLESEDQDDRRVLLKLLGGSGPSPFEPFAIRLERDDGGAFVVHRPDGPCPLHNGGNRPSVTLYDTAGDALAAAERILEADGAELIWCFRR
jgi:hypothetical protein